MKLIATLTASFCVMSDIQGLVEKRVESCVETFLSLYLYYNIF